MQDANLVGRENVSARTGCGMSPVHRLICGAKLPVRVEGAALASIQLGCRADRGAS